ncbi:MAG: LPS export ABC transporter periplasmic protein LptC [Planktothrix sp.]
MRLLLVWVIILIGISACAPKKVEQTSTNSQSKPSEEFERTLTLDDVTLEQADEQGRLLWKIRAKQVSYSKDQKMATVKNPVGELYDEGKLLYNIKADEGEFEQNSKRIFLRNNIVATDPNTGLVLKGNELEWIVQQYIIAVRNGVTGDHAQLQAVAREVQVFYRQKRVEFWDKATVSGKDPVIKLQSDHIIWQLEPQLLTSNMKTQIERYQNQTITDRGVAETAEMNLKTKIGTLKKNAQIALSQPALQISSNELQWNFEKQTISSPQFITLIERDQQVTLTANQGWGDLKNNIFYLTGNVVGIGQKRQAQLNANLVNWSVVEQSFSAEGNVVYRQLDPPFSLMGEKAVGRFENDTIVVSGGNTGTPVVTEIIPED